ncbi:hypothetical protein PoB_006230200 [Plakobranchus ocellatus]|uniref:Uncharacterized protein n=1 Tax=Plakobranchus ocellatus TaxID=259542 RepID=A0AAV4CV54_9GAST|nr:hypothetical protein PoB_006230200 [Plakobranchus ocellatus]
MPLSGTVTAFCEVSVAESNKTGNLQGSTLGNDDVVKTQHNHTQLQEYRLFTSTTPRGDIKASDVKTASETTRWHCKMDTKIWNEYGIDSSAKSVENVKFSGGNSLRDVRVIIKWTVECRQLSRWWSEEANSEEGMRRATTLIPSFLLLPGACVNIDPGTWAGDESV